MATTTNFGWETPDDTDLVKDGAAAIRTALGGVDTSFVDLKGGTTGQVLSKASNTDLDFTWVAQDDSNAIQNAIVDAKGDLIAATAADTPARLAVGANGTVLTADSTEATGLKWATPASGGKVLQVVNVTYSTQANNSTNTYADTGLSATITPTSATSKILVFANQGGLKKSADNTQNAVSVRLMRGATQIVGDYAGFAGYTNTLLLLYPGSAASVTYLDSPATTSATTYKTQFKNGGANAAEVSVQQGDTVSQITLMEIGA